MEKNEKLQKLAEEEKVFNCIMSYRHSKAAVVNDLQKFYKKLIYFTKKCKHAIIIIAMHSIQNMVYSLDDHGRRVHQMNI